MTWALSTPRAWAWSWIWKPPRAGCAPPPLPRSPRSSQWPKPPWTSCKPPRWPPRADPARARNRLQWASVRRPCRPPHPMRLEGKVALVTGGGTGMGRAISTLFAAEGARVAVNYRASQKETDEVVAAIKAAGGEAFAVQANVSVEAEVQAMIAAIDERWGRLDVLVNNAGWSQVTPHPQLDLLTDEIWDRTLDINLRGAFYCVRQAVPLMRRNGGGAIVNNTSASAFHAAGSSLVYSASKAALVNLTMGLARALAPDIRVNAFAPGMVETRFAGWPADSFDKARASTPLEKIASAEEVAQTALFLAAEATALTGETIVIDGGRTRLGPKAYK
ncbi:MAG: glucose 1-dehydrogenase [Acidobacteria bacterium]|nr:glucose 1-dehydrogenase [Acidobacteriota bacterium]